MAGRFSPVPGARESSPFMGGFRKTGGHSGVDFAAAAGSPISAAVPGTVISTGWGGAYGNLVKVRHDDGSIGYYAHLQSVATRPGSRVQRGSLLGRVGSTGNSTGPHLHFEVRRGGKPVNPLGWLQADYDKPGVQAGFGALAGIGGSADTTSVQAREFEPLPEPEPVKLPARSTEGGGFLGTELNLEEQLETELPASGDVSGEI